MSALGRLPRTFWLAGSLALCVIAADQVTKAVVTAEIARGDRVQVLGPLDFTLTYNDGVAFGLAGGSGVLVIGLSLLALVALGFFVAHAPRSRTAWIAAGLVLGGAVGNMVDRLRLGHVTDFILLPHWPAFNLADMAITCGVVALALSLLREEPREDPG